MLDEITPNFAEAERLAAERAPLKDQFEALREGAFPVDEFCHCSCDPRFHELRADLDGRGRELLCRYPHHGRCGFIPRESRLSKELLDVFSSWLNRFEGRERALLTAQEIHARDHR